MNKTEQAPENKESFPEVGEELLKMAKEDQKFRLSMDAKNMREQEREEMSALDSKNTERLKEIVAEIGWPTISKVGKDASHAAWLLVQHAQDLNFQKEALQLMQGAEEGEVKKENIAYLQDRIFVNEGKPQLYGTQHELKEGKWVPYEVGEPENVNERRKEMGMPPLEKATEKLNKGPTSSL